MSDVTVTAIMGERQRNWGLAWLFVIWAVLIVASIAGSNAINLPGALHFGKDHTKIVGSFTIGANRGALSTTRNVSR